MAVLMRLRFTTGLGLWRTGSTTSADDVFGASDTTLGRVRVRELVGLGRGRIGSSA